jgi:hypothetical protein
MTKARRNVCKRNRPCPDQTGYDAACGDLTDDGEAYLATYIDGEYMGGAIPGCAIPYEHCSPVAGCQWAVEADWMGIQGAILPGLVHLGRLALTLAQAIARVEYRVHDEAGRWACYRWPAQCYAWCLKPSEVQ